MEISISSEQDHLLKVAEKSAIPDLLDSGVFYPSLFIHDGSEVTFLQFETDAEVDEIREIARQAIVSDYKDCLAYVFAYDSQIRIDDNESKALILETGDVEDLYAFEFAICYNRSNKTNEPRQVFSKLSSLMQNTGDELSE